MKALIVALNAYFVACGVVQPSKFPQVMYENDVYVHKTPGERALQRAKSVLACEQKTEDLFKALAEAERIEKGTDNE
jgi:hypothetical protein